MSYDKASAPGERDPHFYPTHQHEGSGSHKQATAQMAAERGWFFRSEWYKRLVPDTRKCWVHGEIMFDELALTDAEKDLGYADRNRGMATGMR